ncbi:TetR/AcrR family transcriptional regulator [Streptomyces sp. NPDC020845]|uniref:TetR/AcrR family transcriptional regulator n=1 Tax=Streptomyces sp. NPDC020845 TaxID=3365096 RepID=UPI0037A61213
MAKGIAQESTSTARRARKSAPADSGAASERRAELVRIAAELFAERGYKATTVRAIGDAAGVLSGSLYHHFDSKEAIADELFTSYFDELLAAYREIIESEAGPRDTFSHLVRAAFESIERHHAAVIVLQNEQRYLHEFPRFAYLDDRQREVANLWTGVLEDGIDAGVFREGLNPKVVYRFVRDAIGTTARWYRPSGALKPQELAEQYLVMTLDGITAPRRRPRRPRSASASDGK